MRTVTQGLELLAGSVLTALAAAWFWAHPMALVVGLTPQPQLVPWWYQAAAFPPFGALTLRAVLDGPGRRRVVALLAVCSALALLRLLRWIPLSGHGVFLAAAAVFALPRTGTGSLFVLTSSLLGLAVTAWAKVAWGDEGFFAASVLCGGLIGWWARPPA